MKRHRALRSVASLVGLTLILTVGLPAGASPAQATAGALFVTPGGTGDNCTQLQPCTLATALSLAIDGWTIYVAGGAYTGTGDQVVLLAKSITLRGGWDGATSGAAVTDPQLHPTTLDGENARGCVVVDGGSAPTIEGFIITHGSVNEGAGIYVHDGSPTIQGNLITANAAGWYGGAVFVLKGEAVISGNTITHNTAAYSGGGLYLARDAISEVEGNTIANNQSASGGAARLDAPQVSLLGNIMLQNQSSSAISASGEGLQLTMVNNVVAGGGERGIQLGTGQAELLHNTIVGQDRGLILANDTEATLTNNIVAYQSKQGIVVGTITPLPVTADHNLFWGNGSDPFVGENPVLGPPSFVNRAADDYHLGLGSAAVDAGVDAGVSTDIDGDVRPLGGGFDIGADEWVAPAIYLYLPLLAGTGA